MSTLTKTRLLVIVFLCTGPPTTRGRVFMFRPQARPASIVRGPAWSNGSSPLPPEEVQNRRRLGNYTFLTRITETRGTNVFAGAQRGNTRGFSNAGKTIFFVISQAD